MIQKITLFITGLFLFSGCSHSSPSVKTPENSQNILSEKIEACKQRGFIDYSKSLSKEEEDKIRENLKTTENSQDLEKYFCSQNRAWRAYIAANTHTPVELLWFFSDDTDEIIRGYLASNRNLPDDIAKKLTSDTLKVKIPLARNPSLSEKNLQLLWKISAHIEIQRSLAYNRGTSEAFQKILAEQIPHVDALIELAENPNLSEANREILRQRHIPQLTKKIKALQTPEKK